MTTVSLWRRVRVSRYFHALTSEGQFSVSSVKKWPLNEESIRKPEQNQIQKKEDVMNWLKLFSADIP